MIANVATMDVGIARPGMIVARRFRRKRKMMITTRPAAMSSVSSASRIERETKIDSSNATLSLTPGRQRLLDPRQLVADRVGHLDDVGLRLADHADRHRRRALEPERAPLVLGAELHAAEVLELDQHAAGVGHDQLGELVGRLELAERADGELAAVGLDAAGRHLDVAAPDGLLHVLHGQTARRQLGGGEPYPHREAPLAEDPRLAHARQRLQPALHQPVADVGELEQVVVLAREREPEERLRVGLLLGDDRLAHVLRQAAADAGHLVAHVLRGGLDAALEVELEGDVAEPFGARARKGSQSLDRAQLFLENVGDGRLDHLGIGARQLGADRDDRRIDIGKFPDREPGVADGPEQHEGQAQHAREHRPPDGQVGELHGGVPIR